MMKKIYSFFGLLVSTGGLHAQEPSDGDQSGECYFVTGSYIYWHVGEDGLDLATTAGYLSGINAVVPSAHTDKTIFQDFDYHSGFKVGLGYTIYESDWTLRADYTRLHIKTETSKSASPSGVGEGALYTSNWFYQASSQLQALAVTHLFSKWQLKLDWLDVVLTCPIYSCPKLTLIPFMGLRTSWIGQSLHLDVNGALNFTPPTNTLQSHNHLKSWGIGPRLGIDGHFLLGAGFRMQSKVGTSLVFTQFSKVSHSEDPFALGGSPISYAFHNYNCLRPMAEASLGLGWSTCIANQQYHLDISATYDFNYLWGQNMIRSLNDLNILGTNAAANDLYLHGLTLTASFDF